jgi:hypothetical protein
MDAKGRVEFVGVEKHECAKDAIPLGCVEPAA